MKNCQEWSLAFDQLYNNVTSNKAPGLNEYEKSVFLTDAQDNVVIGLYNGTFGKAFESTEDVSNYLATLVRQEECEEVSGSSSEDDNCIRISPNSVVYSLKEEADEILFRTFEWCYVDSACKKDSEGHPVQEQIVVVPITQDEYWRTIRNPFKKQNANRVLRLEYSKTDIDENGKIIVSKYSELISDRKIDSYYIRYITRPEPIILTDLGDDPESGEEYEGLTIHGKYKAQTCTLDDAIHQLILNEAVRMAKAAWQS